MSHDLESISILLVEDNQVDIDLTLLAFARIKFNKPVQIARDGNEMLDIIEQWNIGAPLPQLILLDIKLPKVSGLEVLKIIKQSKKIQHVPVVMLTSSSNEVDLQTAYELGANSYLIKPVDFEQFLLLTTTLCEYWINLNTKPEVAR
jgi:CheY-like chemotaxis protein